IIHRGPLPLQPPGWDADGNTLAFDGARLALRNVDDAASFVGSLLQAANRKAAEGQLTRTGALRCLPVDLPPGLCAAWAGALLQVNRRPSPSVLHLRRYWRGARRRFSGLRSRLVGQS